MSTIDTHYLISLINHSIQEDAPEGDITTRSILTKPDLCTAKLIAKEAGIFFGVDIIKTIFDLHDSNASIDFFVKDGDKIEPTTCLCSIKSNTFVMLLVERTMLNIIQRLSGIASLTNRFVSKIKNPSINICDTRKTTPGLRQLEKAAVLAGGGTNHRFGLSDMILIKENHIRSFELQGNLHLLPEKIRQAKKDHPGLKAEIEIETIPQLKTLALEDFDIIMLDNFSLESLDEAINICRTRFPNTEIEISGNVTLQTINQYQNFDIDRISIGALTHSVPALDISLLFT